MRPSPTDPSPPAPAVRSGLPHAASRRSKATYSRSDATTGQLGGPRPVAAPQARPRPVPYPGHAPRVVPAPGGRVDPPPQGRVTPPAGNAHPGAVYSPPGLAQGYGQGGYAPNAGYTGTSLITGQPITYRPDPGFSLGVTSPTPQTGYQQNRSALSGGLYGPPLPDPGFPPFQGVASPQQPVQGQQASPLLLALIAAMRGGYGY